MLVEPPCSLLAEIHSVLIYLLRTVPFVRGAALLSLNNKLDDPRLEDTAWSEMRSTVTDLEEGLRDVGNNWERVPLKHSDGRIGWEEALVGCLKDVGCFSSWWFV